MPEDTGTYINAPAWMFTELPSLAETRNSPPTTIAADASLPLINLSKNNSEEVRRKPWPPIGSPAKFRL
jgi:hypothetical protein